MPYLEVISSKCDTGKTLNVNRGVWVIGRDPGDALQLSDPFVSRHHARLWGDSPSGGYTIENYQGDTGTFVGGAKLTGPTRLSIGDQVLIGDTVLAFRDGAPPPNTSKPALKRFTQRAVRTLDVNSGTTERQSRRKTQ